MNRLALNLATFTLLLLTASAPAKLLVVNTANNASTEDNCTPGNWVGGCMDFDGANPANYDVQYLLDPAGAKLRPYTRSPGVYKCPGDRSAVSLGGRRLERIRSVAMNHAVGTRLGPELAPVIGPWLAGSKDANQHLWRTYGKLGNITQPSPDALWVIVDEHPDSLNDGGFAVECGLKGAAAKLVDFPASFHGESCGFAFADGHSEMHKWRDRRTMPAVTYTSQFHLNVPSPNNPDVAWLQDHTAALKQALHFQKVGLFYGPRGCWEGLARVPWGILGDSHGYPMHLRFSLSRFCLFPPRSMVAPTRPGFNAFGLLPIPLAEQLGEGIAEAGQQVLAFEQAAVADQLSLGQTVADLRALGLGVNDPDPARTAVKEVFEPCVDFGAGMVEGKDFHRQVRCSGKKGASRAFEAQRLQPGAADKGDIRRAAVAVLHPKPRAGVEDCAEAPCLVEIDQGRRKPRANVPMVEVVLRAHNQFTVDQFMEVAVLGQGLQLRLRPDFPGRFDRRVHGGKLLRTCRHVEPALAGSAVGIPPGRGFGGHLHAPTPPGRSGIACVARLRALLPQAQVIMLTIEEDSDRVFESMKAGATGYLVKHVAPQEILDAIAEVHRGGAPMSSHIARKVVTALRQPLAAASPESLLSPREEEVLHLLAKGHRSKEIAEELGIGVGTVNTYVRNIYEKLHVRSRAEAVTRLLSR